MAIETATYISDLNSANPGANDAMSEGDDHLRLLKSTVKATFPNVTGAVTASHSDINKLAGGSYTGNVVGNVAGNVTGSVTGNVTGNASTATAATIATNVSGGTASVTTLTTSSTVTHNAGTANGVAYLDGSKVLTTGSALTFDGTNLNVGTTAGYGRITAGNAGSTSYANLLALNGTDNAANGSGIIGLRNNTNAWLIGDTASALGSGTGFISYNYGTAPWIWYLQTGGEQMRLTSTGLGIGTSSPSAIASGYATVHTAGANGGGIKFGTSSTLTIGYAAGSSSGVEIGTSGSTPLTLFTNNVTRATLDTSGNLGLGVTPSAWGGSAAVAIELTSFGAAVSSNGAGATTSNFSHGTFFNGTNWIQKVANVTGARYQQTGSSLGSSHQWFVAPNSTAGNAISFTQSMTLDASGNLGIGTSSPTPFGPNAIGKGLHIAATQPVLRLQGTGTTTGIYDVYVPQNTDALGFFNAKTGTNLATLDSSGNLGLGVTPSAWGANNPAIQMGGTNQSSYVGTFATVFGTNAYFDGSGWRYIQTGGVSALYTQPYAGGHRWFTATSGTAGNAISFTQSMTLDSSGNLGLGVNPSAWSGLGVAFETTGGALLGQGTNNISLFQNTYYSAGFKYKTTNPASAYFQQAGAHQWYTAPSGTAGNAISFTQAMTLDASGNLGIGITSPTAKLHIYEPTAAASRIRVLANGGQQSALQLAGNGTTFGTTSFDLFQDGGSDAYVANRANASLQFWTNNTERARIDSSGNLLVGSTSQFGGADCKLQGKNGSSAQAVSFLWNATTTGDANFVAFGTEASVTQRGSITYNRGAGLTAYNTTSDYRAKDILGPVADSGAVIDSVPVYMGKMKGATQERPMFIAHETPEYAHTGEKDAVDADGNPVYQQMDASALIPVMWAEIQSLRKRLAALEAK